MSTGNDSACVYLVSQEGTKITLPMKYTTHSVLLSDLLAGNTNISHDIPLPLFKENILKKVVAFLEHHHVEPMKEIARPLKSHMMTRVVDPWYVTFIEIDHEQVFQLVQAADYLNIKPLLDLASAKAASLILNKSSEQIRKTLDVPNDFTKEEEEAVKAENRWAEDV